MPMTYVRGKTVEDSLCDDRYEKTMLIFGGWLILPLPFILRTIYGIFKDVGSTPLNFLYLLPTIKHHNP